MGLCFEQIENIKNLFILKEPNSDLYTFFVIPKELGSALFITKGCTSKAALARNSTAVPHQRWSWARGSRMGHTCSSLSCVNKSHRKTQGVDPDLWSLECWSCLDQNPKRPGPWVLPVVEQRIEQTQNERKMRSRYPQSKRNKTSGWPLSLVTSGHRPPPTRFPYLQI